MKKLLYSTLPIIILLLCGLFYSIGHNTGRKDTSPIFHENIGDTLPAWVDEDGNIWMLSEHDERVLTPVDMISLTDEQYLNVYTEKIQ